MGTTGLDVFDTTIHQTNLRLNDLMTEMGIDNRQVAYQSLRAVLHAVRDRLQPGEAADLAAPLLAE